MPLSAESFTVRLEATDCRTALGDASTTCAALVVGQKALRLQPVLASDGGDPVPLATLPDRSLDETDPPNWLPSLDALHGQIPTDQWGTPRRPVFVTSSNFGVGSLYAFQRTRAAGHLSHGTPADCVELVRRRFGWGENVTAVSHACVSAHLGLALATRQLRAGWAERALVFSFDFISPFVAGGFHALKILNGEFPSPYMARASGSIGLGDGAAFAVLTNDRGGLRLGEQSLHNEMHHFTANRPDGAGFSACLAPLAKTQNGRRVWIKGHGTGTLEAGKLEAETLARLFPEAPLVSWKGSLGHTLGSSGLVELALAAKALRAGRTPGTVGSRAPFFTDQVAESSFSSEGYDAALLVSNAFGGAHAACWLSHA